MERQIGYYWVKIKDIDGWIPVEYEGGCWMLGYTDENFEEINETRIEPPK